MAGKGPSLYGGKRNMKTKHIHVQVLRSVGQESTFDHTSWYCNGILFKKIATTNLVMVLDLKKLSYQPGPGIRVQG
jgi:hypothetical protein